MKSLPAITAAAAIAIVMCAVPVSATDSHALRSDAGSAAPASLASRQALGCDRVLDGTRSGQQAIDELGPDLAGAAAALNMSVEEFRMTLLRDPTFKVDPCGMTFVAEPLPTNAELRAGQGPPPAQAFESPRVRSVPTDVFKLSSRPGSLRTIYLDFDGASLAGTEMAAFLTDATAYDLDSNSETFSETERSSIYEVWQRVAEDYSAVDVNVTTESPDPDKLNRSDLNDEQYGVTAFITESTISECGCASLSYIGVFNIRVETYKPVVVSASSLLNVTKYVAEVVSHELGHTLGLRHAGTSGSGYFGGHNAWAPIMGTALLKPISHFSKGEYEDSNNSDDNYATMASYGADPVVDDYLDDIATPSPLTPDNPKSGFISTDNDADAFTFFAAGDTTVQVAVAEAGANLDARLQVFDSNRAVIATVNPDAVMASVSSATGLDAVYQFDAAPGTYYAKVDGAGFGDPLTTGYTNYGSRGAYSLSLDTTTQLSATTTDLPDAFVGTDYAYALSATGGAAPYLWSLESGALPNGLTLSADGIIRGTPTAAGSFSAAFRVNASGPQTAVTGRIGVTVNPRLVVRKPLVIKSPGVIKLKKKRTTSVRLVATGGTSPYRWSFAGKRPKGLSMTAAGRLSIKPVKRLSLKVRVRVTDRFGNVAKRTLIVKAG